MPKEGSKCKQAHSKRSKGIPSLAPDSKLSLVGLVFCFSF